MIGDAAPADAELLATAARLSRRFGEDPQYSRAGGGNSSLKDGGTLYIKPSGVSLASIRPESLMPLALAPLLALAEADGEPAAGSDPVMRVAMAARLRDEGDRRPSVECVFHALIPRRFVIHTHPTTVNALTCARDGEAIARELFGDEVLWVPYMDPGLPLAREIARRREGWRGAAAVADVTLLQNHGLIVAGDDEAAIVERSEAVVAAVRQRIDASASRGAQAPVPALVPADEAVVERLSRILGDALGGGTGPRAVVFDGSADAVRLARTPEGRALVAGGPLMPDQIVYAGSWPLWLDAQALALPAAALERAVADAVTRHVAATGAPPIVVVAEGLGVFASGVDPRRAETARQLSMDATRVGFDALVLGGARALGEAEREFIEHWEAESYRLGIDAQ